MTEIDLALLGGRVRTLDPDRPSATPSAFAGGLIVCRGRRRRGARAVRPAAPRSSTLDGAS